MTVRSTVAGLVVGATLFAGATAHGQFTSNFEAPTYSGSAAGVLLTSGFGGGGQDGWYNPVSGSNDSTVNTYAGNAPGFVPNPQGGDQFDVGTCLGGTAFARGQHANTFGASNEWVATFDIAAIFAGTLPAANNLGSFSLQPSATARFWQTLFNWDNNNNTATTWKCAFMPFSAAGVQAAQPGVLPDPAFADLLPNTWYRVTVTWSFTTNLISEVSITNLHTGAVTTVNPVDYYLAGGAAPTQPLPTDFRLFTGGSLNNVLGWDNVGITVPPAPCYPDCNGDGLLNLADFGCFQTAFATGNMYADCNGDTLLNLADFGCFQTKFAIGCP